MKKHLRMALACGLILANVSCATGGGSPGHARRLGEAQTAVQDALDSMDARLRQAAKELADTGLTGDEAQDILRGLCGAGPWVIDCCTVDAEGTIVAVEPARHADAVGADISGQEQVTRLHETKAPVMSRLFMAVEGVEAIDLEAPMLSPDGALLGSVSILYRPDVLAQQALDGLILPEGWECWVVEPTGRMLYPPPPAAPDGGSGEHGPTVRAPGLAALGNFMRTMPEGECTYRFRRIGGGPPIEKYAYWATVDLHGTQWRIVLTSVYT